MATKSLQLNLKWMLNIYSPNMESIWMFEYFLHYVSSVAFLLKTWYKMVLYGNSQLAKMHKVKKLSIVCNVLLECIYRKPAITSLSKLWVLHENG